MADTPQLIYLEPDDEITSVVRRVRAAESATVVIVAPGRSRATSSAVALRLLAQVAKEEARSISLVADAPTRAVAGEAGIAAFASVAEATSGAVPDPAGATPRAPIRVVRGVSAAAAAPTGAHPISVRRTGAGDETMPVRLPPQAATGDRGPRAGGRVLMPPWQLLAGLLVVALIIGAALLPGATVSITPVTIAVGPKTSQLQLPIAGNDSAKLRATHPGTATGTQNEEVPATGTVTFANWNIAAAVAVPQGSSVSVGGKIAFVTNERIVVPPATVNGKEIVPSHGDAAVTAVVPGLTGNVDAGAIDTVDNRTIRGYLRGSPSNKNRLVTNDQATSGGAETPHTVIQQSDVDAVVTAITADLAAQLTATLAGHSDRVYASAAGNELPQIDVPAGLVGTQDQATFELTGTLAYDRAYVMAADLRTVATSSLAAPVGTSIRRSSIQIEVGAATVNGTEMTVAVTIRAAAAAAIDESAIRDKVAGKTRADAKAAIADQGKVQIDLWPPWVESLPRIPFRITVLTVDPTAQASSSP
jgi:hypothetical protein